MSLTKITDDIYIDRNAITGVRRDGTWVVVVADGVYYSLGPFDDATIAQTEFDRVCLLAGVSSSVADDWLKVCSLLQQRGFGGYGTAHEGLAAMIVEFEKIEASWIRDAGEATPLS
jgi:hypothetical protein